MKTKEETAEHIAELRSLIQNDCYDESQGYIQVSLAHILQKYYASKYPDQDFEGLEVSGFSEFVDTPEGKTLRCFLVVDGLNRRGAIEDL